MGRTEEGGEKENGCPTNSFSLSTLHACLRHGAFYFCLDVSWMWVKRVFLLSDHPAAPQPLPFISPCSRTASVKSLLVPLLQLRLWPTFEARNITYKTEGVLAPYLFRHTVTVCCSFSSVTLQEAEHLNKYATLKSQWLSGSSSAQESLADITSSSTKIPSARQGGHGHRFVL